MNCNWLKKLSSVPFGSTKIWWPKVQLLAPGSRIARAGSQFWPPSVVRENIVKTRALPNRAQVAYANCELVGSAVTEYLSCLSKLPVPVTIVVGAPQVRPPSVDLLTRTAFGLPEGGMSCPPRLRYTSPLGANDTHGSLAWG